MQTFSRLDAIACPLPIAGIDTDQLIPARFMTRSRAEGYGRYLLHDLRFGEDGRSPTGHPLDAARYRNARILVARRNFGSGSSREAAVYALADFGLRCVIAPSFGDIFAANAVKNGLLPAQIGEADAEALLAALASAETPRLAVDLERQAIAGCGLALAFAIDPARRLQLLNGWDDIDLTLQQADAIARFRARCLAQRPWSWPMPPR